MNGLKLRAAWLSLALLMLCAGQASAQVQATASATFTPSTVVAGGSNTSTFDLTITNPNASSTLTGIVVSVTFPSGITRGTTGTITCAGGGGTNPTSISFNVTSLSPGESCDVNTFVQAGSLASGPILVTSSTVVSNEVGTPGPGASATLTVTALAATSFSVTGSSPVQVFNQDTLTISCLDQRGNTFTGYAGTVNLTSSEDPFLVYSSGNPVTLTNGTGLFNVAPKKAGLFTVTATDSVNPSITGTSSALMATPGPTTAFVVSASTPQTAGTGFSFTVTAVDLGNNTTPTYGGTVAFSASDGLAVLPGNSTLTNGVGTFSVTLKTAGNQTITATDTVISSITGTSGSIAVSPAAAMHFSVSAPASTGQNVSFNFTVTALDQFNNTVNGYVGTVHFTSSDATATLPANATLTNGVGTFSATLKTLGNQTITATDTVTSSITGTSGNMAVDGATSFVVTSLADSGAGSLRAAITNANGSSTGGAITFNVTGTIHLLSALPILSQSMSITGPGASSLAVDGGGAAQVFVLGGGLTETVAISGVTVQNGNGPFGGGIYNEVTLTLTSCVVTNNTAVGTSGVLGNASGGGIYNSGNLTINQCTVSNNDASGAHGGGLGGGLANVGGATTITNSTFSGNTADGGSTSAGGGQGGGIYNAGSPLTLVGSTIAGNKVSDPLNQGAGAGGAIYSSSSTVVISNSTISDNSQTSTFSADEGGGVSLIASSCTLTNTILAGNTDSGSVPNPDGTGAFTDGGNNLIGDGTGITGITNGANGNQVGTSGAPLNPQLGALANNGGPTATMLPGGYSPALGAGNPAGFLNTDTDQRGTGFLRLRNGVVDIGAVQLQGVALTASAGTPQSASIGATFATNLAATATESCAACASTVPGVTVTFTAPGSGASGTFAGGVNTAVTNSSGVATAQPFTANMILGPYTVAASATTPDQASPASANFLLTNAVAGQTITGFGPINNRTYGDASFAILGVAATSGLTVSFASGTPSVCTVAGTIVTINAAGICSITASQAGNLSFPAAPNVTQGFTVNKAVLIVTANNASKASGAPLPALSASITGFAHGDSSGVVTGSPSLTTAATAFSPAGTYAIFVSSGTLSAANYTFLFVDGTLTVNGPQPATISVVSGSGQASGVGSAFGAPLITVVKDGSGAKVSGVFVTFSVVSGTATLSSTQVATGFDGTAQITATPTAAGAITIFASASGLNVPATFDETGLAPSAAAQLSALPAALAFHVVQGGSNPLPASVAVSNTGAGTLPWTASASGNPSWLKLSPLSGSTPAVMTASIDITGLMAGTYPTTITVTSGSQHQTVSVTLTVAPPASPEFALSPLAIIVDAAAGSTTLITRVVQVPNGGAGTLAWTAAADPASPWLSVSPTSGSSAAGKDPATVTVQIDPSGLAAGQYLGNISFSSSGAAPANVPVILNLSALPDLISSIPLVEFHGLAGTSFAPQTLPITTTTGSSVSFTASASVNSGQNWLSLGGANGATPGSISVSVNTSGLAAGYYVGFISVGSTGAANTLVIPVVLDLGTANTPGTLSASPGGVLFSGPANAETFAAISRTITISSDSASFTWNAVALANSGGTWLAVSPASGRGNGTMMVTASPTGLAPGSYSGQVLISATGTSNAVLIIPVTFLVYSGGTEVTGANTLQPIQPADDFIATAGVPVALQASILSPTAAPVTGATVQVAFTTGDAPVILTDVGGGNYTGVWTPVHAGAASLLFTSPNLPAGVVTGVVLASASLPAVPADGVVNAGPMISGAPLGIGSIAALFGLNLASQPASANSFPLPLTLSGASVTINGIPAPLFYASPLQINFFVPYELAGETTATIQVATPNGLAVATGVPITPQSPGLFLTNAAGDPSVIHANGQPVSAASPAAGGEIVEIFATGLGPVTNAPADNAAAPVSPLAKTKITPRVIIGGVDAEVRFAGLAPGFAGLNQINVVVPKGLPPGPATLIIAVGPLFGNTAILQVH